MTPSSSSVKRCRACCLTSLPSALVHCPRLAIGPQFLQVLGGDAVPSDCWFCAATTERVELLSLARWSCVGDDVDDCRRQLDLQQSAALTDRHRRTDVRRLPSADRTRPLHRPRCPAAGLIVRLRRCCFLRQAASCPSVVQGLAAWNRLYH